MHRKRAADATIGDRASKRGEVSTEFLEVHEFREDQLENMDF